VIVVRKVVRSLTAAMPGWLLIIFGVCLAIPLGQTGQGDWADRLLELDSDFGKLLDLLDELDLAGDTVTVSALLIPPLRAASKPSRSRSSGHLDRPRDRDWPRGAPASRWPVGIQTCWNP
jgi:hypothetical protein